MKKKICKMKKKNWEMKKNLASQHRFCWAKWRKRFSKWRKKISKWRNFFLILVFFFFNYTNKTHKLKKAICTFIFTFIQCSNLFLLFKNFKMVHSGVKMDTRESQNGHSGPLKCLVSLDISKLGLLAHFWFPLAHFIESPMSQFEIFLTTRKYFLIKER